jgi:hypothetical protein
LIRPIENFSGYRAFINIGSSSPPIERMVTPDPAQVKMAHPTAVVMARPPGSQPNSAVYTRRSRVLAPPSANRYPASVNSGREGSTGEATSR